MSRFETTADPAFRSEGNFFYLMRPNLSGALRAESWDRKKWALRNNGEWNVKGHIAVSIWEFSGELYLIWWKSITCY